MSLRIFNSLSKQEEVFESLETGKVRMYTCGPTVYNYAHIGNFFAYLSADTLYRWLQFGEGYDVKWVMNITDIDDKTIRDSKEKFPHEEPMKALNQFCRFYEDEFKKDLKSLNITGISVFPRATEFIIEQQELVRSLYKKGFAYIADDSVYFDIQAYKKAGNTYGCLVHIDEGFQAGARVNQDEYEKASAADFVLWKGYKEGEPFWEFQLPITNAIEGFYLKQVKTDEEWAFVHDLREKEIFEKYHPEKKYWRENPDDRDATKDLVVLTDGKNLLGTTRIDDIGDDTFSFRMLAIDPQYQGKGHGKTLLQLAENWAIKRGVKKLYVNSEKETKDFYEKFGFMEGTEGEKMDYEVVPMIKNLDVTMINLKGRPGWHLECSAMEEKILGLPFDIHTGGVDLKFPHHEDEIAQSCGGYGIDPTKYWVHNGHLLVEGEKMSKSKGNFFRLADLVAQGWEPEVIRLAIVTNHYRGDFNFTQNGLHAAKKNLRDIRRIYECVQKFTIFPENTFSDDKMYDYELSFYKDAFFYIMRNDLSTNVAWSSFLEFINKIPFEGGIVKSEQKNILEFFDFVSNIFGVDFRPQEIQIPEKIKKLAEQQKQFKAEKNFAEADRIRDELKEKGFAWDQRKDEVVKI